MFVTHMPGRIVGTKLTTFSPKTTQYVGKAGLYCRIKSDGDGLVLVHETASDSRYGYVVSANEIIEFTGRVILHNPGDNPINVSIMIFDTV